MKKAKDRDEDITDDNQLYEALNVLKGFQLLGKKVSNETKTQD